ncbi:arylamine N-acetyltransferase [Mycolicibacterium fluoranthenivorans]|uniref:Arylamine N-acetyltransferase n=1 Tax=Mycolicibacterium fluoranthenivorans TaxID=258505 RepID=A0A7G8PNI6_9MYCO|nr:arylamine N-acetyltransferase [Mycolicibacterium fluoranthenivorans]QNJ95902.1 arylamine N-acetyltransferase [Mycolicibacterium fluoranthenivorans]
MEKAYFARIGVEYPVVPSLDTLRDIVAAHNRSIPFENLDPLMGIPVHDLSAEALSAKLVGRRRGGYCYENNGLLAYVLEHLGYGVDRLAGRVVWMRPPDAPKTGITHNVLAVTVPGEDGRFLVDVGFGGQTLSSPIRLQAGPVQHTRHEPYRLVDHPEGLQLQTQIHSDWLPLYQFSLRTQPLVDLSIGSWYSSTYPTAVFVVGLSVALVTDTARWNLRGRNLAIHTDGSTEKIRLASAAEVLEQLTGRFGIDLAGLGDVEARVSQVLDT